jgi:hypothetical protein
MKEAATQIIPPVVAFIVWVTVVLSATIEKKALLNQQANMKGKLVKTRKKKRRVPPPAKREKSQWEFKKKHVYSNAGFSRTLKGAVARAQLVLPEGKLISL